MRACARAHLSVECGEGASSPLSEWRRDADIFELRTNECNLCVGNELIQAA